MLERAVKNLNDCRQGKKDRSSWSGDYFDFIQCAPKFLSDLGKDRDRALRENSAKIEKHEVAVLGTYESAEQAKEAARWLKKKREATLNAGWLNVHVVVIPQQSDVPPADN